MKVVDCIRALFYFKYCGGKCNGCGLWYCSGNVRVCYGSYYVLFEFSVNKIWPGSTY